MRRTYLLRRKRARLIEVTSDVQESYPVNQPLTITFDVEGGREPYNLELFTGTLPDGLSVNDLTITGTPTSTGESWARLRVSDFVDTVKPVYVLIKVV